MQYPTIKQTGQNSFKIQNSADSTSYTVRNTHREEACKGEPCVLHNPSDHHMRDFPLIFRQDSTLFERQCAHGIGHPDPDSLEFFVRNNMDYMAIHGCDGCCEK